jgi:hypothetical protein
MTSFMLKIYLVIYFLPYGFGKIDLGLKILHKDYLDQSEQKLLREKRWQGKNHCTFVYTCTYIHMYIPAYMHYGFMIACNVYVGGSLETNLDPGDDLWTIIIRPVTT